MGVKASLRIAYSNKTNYKAVLRIAHDLRPLFIKKSDGSMDGWWVAWIPV